eukprot:m.221094 g.221094  ORF g.221094 m.221094 type:complete len:55 (-) comp54161_c0_seq23:137-301(-)
MRSVSLSSACGSRVFEPPISSQFIKLKTRRVLAINHGTVCTNRNALILALTPQL